MLIGWEIELLKLSHVYCDVKFILGGLMKVGQLIKFLQMLDSEKEILITIPDTSYYSDFSFNSEKNDVISSCFDRDTGWYLECEGREEVSFEHYVIYLWL